MKIPFSKRSNGATLVETLIGVAIGGIVIACVCGFIFYDAVSKAALYNYVELNQRSMQALDKMTSELREMIRVTEVDSGGKFIKFQNASTNMIVFSWDADGQVMTRENLTLGGKGDVLLENCYHAEFKIYSAVPDKFGGTNFNEISPAGNVTLAKMVMFRWSCERDISSRGQRNTESVQTAKIVLRN